MLLAGTDRMAQAQDNLFNWQPMYLPPYPPDLNPLKRIWLTMIARWFNNPVCKNEEKLLERLDQAILDVSDNPDYMHQTTASGTLFWQTLYTHRSARFNSSFLRVTVGPRRSSTTRFSEMSRRISVVKTRKRS
jgi:hypothetical protein